MSDINELHDQAMNLVDYAFVAKQRGHGDDAVQYYRQALKFEVNAAEILRDQHAVEPTRSILYRSAASIALNCGEHREAERLIALALSGQPPVEIAEELRDLFEQVNFERHLALRGITLANGEMQLSIAGKAVGFGFASSEAIIGRVEDMRRLIHRTAARKLQQPFSERVPERIKREYDLFVSMPRAASFALTLRLGWQMDLPGMSIRQQIVEEIITCFNLINAKQEEEVKEIIEDPSYYRNFVGLAKRIAPDGRDVNLVGITSTMGNHERRAEFRRTQDNIVPPGSNPTNKSVPTGSTQVVRGQLRMADAMLSTQRIKLVEPNGTKHNIIVPEGLMNDIVRPLWDEVVEVEGVQKGKSLVLNWIRKAAETDSSRRSE